MDKIWAPWRKKYITLKKEKKCIFCITKKKSSDAKRYVLKRSKYAFSMLNLYPYNNAHVMVAPKRHVKTLTSLSEKESLDLLNLVNHTTKK